jgi:hypothetical protein
MDEAKSGQSGPSELVRQAANNMLVQQKWCGALREALSQLRED